jgi:type I restriction enzyme M protein
VRDLADDRLSNLIERISEKRLGLGDVEPDIIGRSYEYLIRKFPEGSVSSAGEFYTPKEVGLVMARIIGPPSAARRRGLLPSEGRAFPAHSACR